MINLEHQFTSQCRLLDGRGEVQVLISLYVSSAYIIMSSLGTIGKVCQHSDQIIICTFVLTVGFREWIIVMYTIALVEGNCFPVNYCGYELQVLSTSLLVQLMGDECIQ